VTNHLKEIDEINEIDEIILPYTTKANTFLSFDRGPMWHVWFFDTVTCHYSYLTPLTCLKY